MLHILAKIFCEITCFWITVIQNSIINLYDSFLIDLDVNETFCILFYCWVLIGNN